MNALTSATTITVSDSDQAHFPLLASASGEINVTATTAANFGALTNLAADASIGVVKLYCYLLSLPMLLVL